MLAVRQKWLVVAVLCCWQTLLGDAWQLLKMPSVSTRLQQQRDHRSHIPHTGFVQRGATLRMTNNDAELQGFDNFVRSNPKTDIFTSRGFHHVEFYTGEATASMTRFMLALGMEWVAKSDFSTGNSQHASYMLQSGDVRMVFTSPYAGFQSEPKPTEPALSSSFPGFNLHLVKDFIGKHGLAVRAIAVEVDDVRRSVEAMASRGARIQLPPTTIQDTQGDVDVAEIYLYGDVVLRLLNKDRYRGVFLPQFEAVPAKKKSSTRNFGIQRFDHMVSNVWKLEPVVSYLKNITGFHEFAEFVADDVGTVDSGLNSVVLANNNEYILLPVNEPTFGTKRKSQIQTFLEQHQGEGVQHLALYTADIFATLQQMRDMEDLGCGFSFMESPGDSYYINAKQRLGEPCPLTEEQFALAKKFNVLLDKDDQGVLLQIFTKPIGDRPTSFIEIIQRIGCVDAAHPVQKPGCGGFGKGNFKDLFKSIEDYENALGIN